LIVVFPFAVALYGNLFIYLFIYLLLLIYIYYTGPQKKVVCAGVLTILIPCIFSR